MYKATPRYPLIALKDSVNVLRKANMNIAIRSDGMLVQRDGQPDIGVHLNRDPQVREVSVGLTLRTELAASHPCCEVRFEIDPGDADQTATIQWIAQMLQHRTTGLAYPPWNRQLSGLK